MPLSLLGFLFETAASLAVFNLHLNYCPNIQRSRNGDEESSNEGTKILRQLLFSCSFYRLCERAFFVIRFFFLFPSLFALAAFYFTEKSFKNHDRPDWNKMASSNCVDIAYLPDEEKRRQSNKANIGFRQKKIAKNINNSCDAMFA